jgi:DNA repair exonuclease SbcCD ATPase subunit
MTDERERAVDVSTVRERVAERADIDAAEDVLDAIEERAEDGRLDPDAFAEWRRACRRRRRSTAEDAERIEARYRELLESVAPADRDSAQARTRIEEYEEEFDSVRSGLSTVADWLAAVPEAPGSAVALYEGAEQLRRCERAIHEVEHTLHHVEEGVEEFETWLHDPAARIDALGDEIGGFERYLDNTEGLVDRLEASGGDGFDPFDAWLAAYHLQRVMAVVVDELRTDVEELEAWLARREGDYGDEVARLRDRLDSLSERHAACSQRLDAASEHVDGFAEKWAAVAASIDEFEAALDGLEQPVDWAEVEGLVQEQFDDLGIQLR